MKDQVLFPKIEVHQALVKVLATFIVVIIDFNSWFFIPLFENFTGLSRCQGHHELFQR